MRGKRKWWPVLAVLLLPFLMADACDDEKGKGDAPTGPKDDSKAQVINMPDEFFNIVEKCDGFTHLLQSNTRGDASPPLTDPIHCPEGHFGVPLHPSSR